MADHSARENHQYPKQIITGESYGAKKTISPDGGRNAAYSATRPLLELADYSQGISAKNECLALLLNTVSLKPRSFRPRSAGL